MKARFFKKISFGLVLSALPFVGGCNQQTTETPSSLLTAAEAEPFIAPDTSAAALAAGPVPLETPPPPEDLPVPTPATTAGKTLPPNIKPSSPVGEIVKLAQSGVDENVMLTYITNSTSTFNLSSDEIIYLNDIGAPNNVITAMIQRDQALKQSWTDAAQAQNAAAQANAQVAQGDAPSYVNPPQPEPEAQPTQTVDAGVYPPPQAANITYDSFYDSLAPYGSWVDVEGYGRCWQPTVVVANRAWRPYCDGGRWIYTDCGWYWYSDYSWGWAPFHYGRWVTDARLGWCWYPGYTWGPAWVNWRYTDGYCGWAPLPPAASYTTGVGFTYYGGSVGVSFGFGLGSSCYTFVPWTKFCGYRPNKYCAPPHQANQIYQNSTVINNYVSGNNNTIVNQGIPIDRVRRHTGTEIRQVSIRETRNTTDRVTRGERFERDGRTLIVRRPQISQPANVAATPPRFTRGSQPGHMPVAGAGAAAQIEPSRSHGLGRNPVQSSTVFSGSAHVTSPVTSPSPGGNRGTMRGQNDRPENLNRDALRGNNRTPTTSPIAVRNGDRVPATSPTVSSVPAPSAPQGTTVNTPSAQKAPPGSLVMIGRRDSNPGQNGNSDSARYSNPNPPTVQKKYPPGSIVMIGRRDPDLNRGGNSGRSQGSVPTRTEPTAPNVPNWTAVRPAPTQPSAAVNQGQTRRISTPAPTTSFSYNRPTTAMQRHERHEAPRPIAPPQAQPSMPVYSAPRATPAPAYTAPSYSAPRPSPAPAPTYTPAPSYTPAPAPQRSQSGPNGSSRRNAN